ncbi:MAG: tetratricopeptide repeat protein [Myxococcota bacterium]
MNTGYSPRWLVAWEVSFVVLLGLAPVVSFAQDTQDPGSYEPGEDSIGEAQSIDAARRSFRLATVALEEGRPAEARDLFRRSAAAYPTVEAWFNLGMSLRRTGEPSEAVDIFVRILDGEFGNVGDDRRGMVVTQLEEARGELSVVTVRIDGAPAEVWIDEAPRGRTQNGTLVVSIDPGQHRIVARRGEVESEAVTRILLPGGAEPVRLRFRQRRATDSLSARATPSGHSNSGSAIVEDSSVEDRERGFGQAWHWALIAGAAVLVVAGAVIAAIALTGEDEPGANLRTGDVLPVTRTLLEF